MAQQARADALHDTKTVQIVSGVMNSKVREVEVRAARDKGVH
jgi:hypothetical protein